MGPGAGPERRPIMANMREEITKLISDTRAACYETEGVAGRIFVIAPSPTVDFGWAYRRIANFTTHWEHAYVTGVNFGGDITLFIGEEAKI